MATLSEQHPGSLKGTIMSVDDAVPRQPPLLAVGPLAWIKKNLFNTVFDSVLTIIVSIITVSLLASFITWTVTQANWYSINFNLNLLMTGRFEESAQWRVTLVVLLSAATVGLALAAWAQVGQRLLVVLVTLIALMFIVPLIIYATLPLPPLYMSAGEVKIGGESGQSPQADVAFIGRAGETISLQLASEYGLSDFNLAGLHSFADPTVNAALNAAANRLQAEKRIAELQALLAGDTLTDNQRSRTENELSKLTTSDPVTDTLKLNQQAVRITVLLGSSLEPISGGEGSLEEAASLFTVTLPEDGWYILRKELDDPQAISILEASGIYPILERTLTRSAGDSGGAAGSYSEFVRVTDLFTTQAELPRAETGREFPFTGIINHQYRGASTLVDYLRLYVAPFLNQINVFFLVVVIAGAVGYVGGRTIDRYMSPSERPRHTSSKWAVWLLGIMPIVAFVAIWGFSNDGVRQLLLLLFTAAWVAAAYIAGTQLMQRSNLAILIIIVVLGVLFRANNLVFVLLGSLIGNLSPNANLALAITTVLTILVLILVALIGRSQGKGIGRRGLIVGLIFCAIFIIISIVGQQQLPQVLSERVPLTDTGRWGGFLLTMLLTVVGIIGSLPLGIMLALGRRSKAPVISTVCTIYIEVLRGVPFVTVLFMAQLLIPLINPELSSFPGAFRAMIATVLFTAAYNAEVVRGGLQAIPPGQEEAAKAVGLSGLQVTLFITLPQALRLVIPPMMGNFVGMFKDTSLVAIVGLLDLTGMAQNVVAQTEFLGLRREAFMFIVIIYFVVSYVIAAISRRIEASGSGRALKMQI